MAIEIVADFRILMRLATNIGRAKKSGDQAAIAQAQRDHDAYKAICLRADKLALGLPHSAL